MSSQQQKLTEAGTSRYVQVGPVRVHYNEAGSGPPLICIHGGGPAAAGWRHYYRNIEALSEHFQTLLVDLPGAGKSDRPTFEGSRFTFITRVLDEIMEALGIETASFLGWSAGARTVLKFAAAYPNRVRRLVAVGTGAEFDAFSPRPTMGQRRVGAVSKPSGLTFNALKDFVQVMVFDTKRASDEEWKGLLDDWHLAATAEAAERSAGSAGPSSDHDLYFDLPKVSQEALLIWGRDDYMGTGQPGFLMLQRMPNAEMHVFSRCGHWVQWEKAEEFNRLVIGFLRGTV